MIQRKDQKDVRRLFFFFRKERKGLGGEQASWGQRNRNRGETFVQSQDKSSTSPEVCLIPALLGTKTAGLEVEYQHSPPCADST